MKYSFPGNVYLWNPYGLYFTLDNSEWGFPYYITENATFLFTWYAKLELAKVLPARYIGDLALLCTGIASTSSLAT